MHDATRYDVVTLDTHSSFILLMVSWRILPLSPSTGEGGGAGTDLPRPPPPPPPPCLIFPIRNGRGWPAPQYGRQFQKPRDLFGGGVLILPLPLSCLCTPDVVPCPGWLVDSPVLPPELSTPRVDPPCLTSSIPHKCSRRPPSFSLEHPRLRSHLRHPCRPHRLPCHSDS